MFSFSQESQEVTITDIKPVEEISNFPEGFYYTYDDFLNKRVKPPLKLFKKNMRGETIMYDEISENQIFFYSRTTGEKVTDVFAICVNGKLYIEQKYLSKYAKKGNKGESADNPYSYHRVVKEGKFLYLEGVFANAWATGAAYNLGAAGGAYASSLKKLKGVVFDFETKKFDFIKNCKDFQLFLNEYKYAENIDCDNFDILKVREIINKMIVQ